MANDGAGTYWDEDSPGNNDAASLGAQEIRDLRKGVDLRVKKEHEAMADTTTIVSDEITSADGGGEHKAGSAKAFYGDETSQTTRPDGETTLNAGDNGRILVANGDGSADQGQVFYCLGGSWTNVVMVTANLKDGSVTTDKIADANVTVGKLAGTLDLSTKDVTLNDPTITTFVNATHDHTDNANGGTLPSLPAVHLQNSSGNRSIGGSWTTRTLNDEVSDSSNICSLSGSDTFTLDAGTYLIQIGYTVKLDADGKARTRLYDTNGASLLGYGTEVYTFVTNFNNIIGYGSIKGIFVLDGTETLAVQSAATVSATEGSDSGSSYVHTNILALKLA